MTAPNSVHSTCVGFGVWGGGGGGGGHSCQVYATWLGIHRSNRQSTASAVYF